MCVAYPPGGARTAVIDSTLCSQHPSTPYGPDESTELLPSYVKSCTCGTFQGKVGGNGHSEHKGADASRGCVLGEARTDRQRGALRWSFKQCMATEREGIGISEGLINTAMKGKRSDDRMHSIVDAAHSLNPKSLVISCRDSRISQFHYPTGFAKHFLVGSALPSHTLS